MKKLILVRHSKAANVLGAADIDRHLTKVGIERAYKISEALKKSLVDTPEYWLSSPANRALHTAIIFGRAFNTCGNLKIDHNLYTFDDQEVIDIINELPILVDSAILFGHNNAFLNVINKYSDYSVSRFKTCSVAVININDKRWDATENASLDFIIDKDNFDEL